MFPLLKTKCKILFKICQQSLPFFVRVGYTNRGKYSTFSPESSKNLKNMPAINKILRGRYRIIQQIGDNDAGTIYTAHDNVREATVALKEILIDVEKYPSINQRELLKRQFADEAKSLSKVKHEALPQVRGFFSETDRQYLVMELVDGDDASEILAKNKQPIAVSDLVNWADQLLDALDYLHTLAPPVIHGNIKPQNVKLTPRGRIKLLDFGIAKSADAENRSGNSNQISVAAIFPYSPLEQILQATDLTAQSEITNGYGARIEKILKQTADARADVYALGATLYHLATGEVPVDALERALNVWAGEADSLKPAREINQAVSVEVSNVLKKAMEIDRDRRFKTAAEMRQVLQTAMQTATAREAEETKNLASAAARESLLAGEKKLEQERQQVEQERLRLEVEQKEQKELIARQLKEAEAQRVEAEQRAADAEKKLKEKEAKLSADAKRERQTAAVSSAKPATQPFANKKSQPEEFNSLFTEPKSSSASRMLPVAGLIVLLLGGAAWGIWAWQKSGAVEANQKNPKQETVQPEKPAIEQKAKIDQQPEAIKTSETGQTPAPVASSFTESSTAEKTAVKNKPVAPKADKPAAPAPTKAAPKPKKAVTVDDLIGGN